MIYYIKYALFQVVKGSWLPPLSQLLVVSLATAVGRQQEEGVKGRALLLHQPPLSVASPTHPCHPSSDVKAKQSAQLQTQRPHLQTHLRYV